MLEMQTVGLFMFSPRIEDPKKKRIENRALRTGYTGSAVAVIFMEKRSKNAGKQCCSSRNVAHNALSVLVFTVVPWTDRWTAIVVS